MLCPAVPRCADVIESILGDGCVVGEGSKIVKSVVGLRSRIKEVGGGIRGVVKWRPGMPRRLWGMHACRAAA